MLPKEKKQLYKLQKRISVLLIIILFLVYWLKNKYDDVDFSEFENESLRIENYSQHSEIVKLKQENDSLRKSKEVKLEKVVVKNKINTKKEPIIKDTIIPTIEDTFKRTSQDTL